MTENNAICKICGKPYHVCLSCADAIRLKPWQTYCCSSDCYKVFQVVRGFSTGVYSKDEFKKKLQNIDLSDLDSYREHIKTLIKDVLKEEKNKELVIAESIVETESAIIEEKEVEKNEEEVSTISMVAPSRKKKYKVEIE